MFDTINALTRFYNIGKKRKGPLFFPQFRSRQILTQEQLIHVSRYLHLNPYSAGLVKTLSQLETYQPSSLHQYLHKGCKSYP